MFTLAQKTANLQPTKPHLGLLTLSSLALVVLTACGGGDADGRPNKPTPSEPIPLDVFGTLTPLANYCAAPGPGDALGTVRDEQNFLAAWTRATYLWPNEVNYGDPAKFATAIDYFQTLKTNVITNTGKPKDQYHFSMDTEEANALYDLGEEVGYGVGYDLSPERVIVVYTEPGSPATALSSPLKRGTEVLQVDGIDINQIFTKEDANKVNAGLFPKRAGERHQWVVRDPGARVNRTITLVAATITKSPVQNVRTLANGSVGYLLFNDHIASAEPALVTAINQLKAAQVSDLVIDLRYNGGGMISVASQLSYMVAGPAKTANQQFTVMGFNDQLERAVPDSEKHIPFFDTTESGQPLPTLNLPRVYVLTSANTCSASESIINGLRGVNVEVIQIGDSTCGKPFGFVGTPNCGTTYYSVQMQGKNAKGFGDYANGFAPRNGSISGIAPAAVLPGCMVQDDLTRALGDPTEAQLAAALQYRSNGTCPAVAMAAQAAQHANPLALEGLVRKNPLLTNAILRPKVRH